MREEMLGGLRARITGGRDRQGGGDGPAVILLHGFGAPGDDLVPLWRVLDVPAETRFVFPEAPLALPPAYGTGRAWWMIDLERMMRVMNGQVPELDRSNEEIPELPAVRAQVSLLVDEVESKLGASKIFLGGFSQGAMLSCDVALRWEKSLAGLILMSGTLINEREWRELAPHKKGLHVLQSHGREDQLLAFATAEKLRDLLTGAGLGVDWIPFRGGHQIPDAVLQRVAAMVTAG